MIWSTRSALRLLLLTSTVTNFTFTPISFSSDLTRVLPFAFSGGAPFSPGGWLWSID